MPRILPPESRVAQILHFVRERTGRDACRLLLHPEKKPLLTGSKCGGLPYWNLSLPYPRDSRGNRLRLLLQLSLSEVPASLPLPHTGLLQFFIAQDEVHGLSFEEPDVQTGFRVVWHPRIDATVTAEALLAHGIPALPQGDDNEGPVFREATVEPVPARAVMSVSDTGFEAVFAEAVQALFGETVGEGGWFDYLTEEESNRLCEALLVRGNWLLGYPEFTQEDPRCSGRYASFDTLLLQLDSDEKGVLTWGDCGTANFFIPHDALLRQDFSRILYHWDCC